MLRDLVIARLKAQVPALKRVGMAIDLAAAKADISVAFPRAYVMTLGENGGTSRYLSGAVAQKRSVRIGVVLMVKNVRDNVGTATASDMDALRQVTDSALFGWGADDAHSPLIFARGSLLGLAEGELWWQDEYTTEFDRR
jgi:hypothetical protein